MTDTAIEWTRGPDGRPGKSWNPIRARNKATGGIGHFCVHVTEACRNCYAETFQKRFRNFIRYARQDRDQVDLFLDHETLMEPLHWKKPRRIFVCSMTDLFLEDHPDSWIDQVFAVMAQSPQHIFIVLTKRGARLRTWFGDDAARRKGIRAAYMEMGLSQIWLPNWPLRNVQIGVSCHDQASANRIIPDLLATPAAVRFISAEPLLGPIDLEAAWHGETALDSECWGDCSWCSKGFPPLHNCRRMESSLYGDRYQSGLDWVIVGGESGPRARPMDVTWARSIVSQCEAAGVPVFVKQLGAYPVDSDLVAEGDAPACGLKDKKGGDPSEWPRDLRVREFPRAKLS